MTKKTKTAVEKITRQEKLSLGNTIMLDKSLSPATRLVGWYITDHINTRRGYAWPPQENIADKLGLTTRTVQRAMKDLSRYFKINRRFGLANEYRPIPSKLIAIAPTQPPTICRVTPDIFDTQPPTKRTPHPSNDPNKHPINNSALAFARAAPIGIGDRQKWLAIFERKLKSKAATDEEIKTCRALCLQIINDPHSSNAAFAQADRLLETYDELDPLEKSQRKETNR